MVGGTLFNPQQRARAVTLIIQLENETWVSSSSVHTVTRSETGAPGLGLPVHFLSTAGLSHRLAVLSPVWRGASAGNLDLEFIIGLALKALYFFPS